MNIRILAAGILGASVFFICPSFSFAAATPSDFNGDGKSDILMQDDNGNVGVWLQNGATTIGGVQLPYAGAQHLRGSGDYNSDGKADVIIQDDTGNIGIWMMNGTTAQAGVQVTGYSGSTWHVRGGGDFTGEGKDDFIFQHDNGNVMIWMMNGTVKQQEFPVSRPGSAWLLRGSAEFDGNDRPDLLWYNPDTGHVGISLMGGATAYAFTDVGEGPGYLWHLRGAGDYNGDGHADLLWQKYDGSLKVTYMNRTTALSTVDLSSTGPTFHAITGTTPHATKMGIVYLLWQCRAQSGPDYNISTIEASGGNWAGKPGPFNYYWWGQPALGYYCLTNNTAVLTKHAEMLRDAGIDFIALESTNSPYATNAGLATVMDGIWYDMTKPEEMIVQPAQSLFSVWSTIPGAPKIAPWVPLKNDPPAGTVSSKGTACSNAYMFNFFDSMLNPVTGQYKSMGFYYQGKPLLLGAYSGIFNPSEPCLNPDGNHKYNVDPEKAAALSSTYTIRKYWALIAAGNTYLHPENGDWTVEPCQSGFLASGGTIPCNQPVSYANGQPEEIGVTSEMPGPPTWFHSDLVHTTPKLGGNTFHQYMQRFWQYPSLKIVLTYAWNGWIDPRYPCEAGGQNTGVPCDPETNLDNYGNAIFMNMYNAEYNNDMEPSIEEGDKYYRLMVKEIAAIKDR